MGVVTGEAVPARDFTVTVDGQRVPLVEAPHEAPGLAVRAAMDDEETEWIVPVRWVKTIPRDEAIGFKGRYANQNTATRLTHALTRETVLERLGIAEEELDAVARTDAVHGSPVHPSA